jgi:alkanesulfonate monooxygenase SsuD/methylene tetrahydromethanopterin reductase-like flavin-dependent oxidoreductase (luciferase family)
MEYGFVLPSGTAPEQLDHAVAAEAAGWDAVFAYESAYGVDPWSLLSAMAVRTERIRLGTMLTPLPFRRPWKVASQVVTLDQLSNGRAILAVGLGATDLEIGVTGEEEDLRVRAAQLDEGLDLIAGLWAGEAAFLGEHYEMDLSQRGDLATTGVSVQQPRPPIWVVGLWNRPRSMRRVTRFDGIVPQGVETPDQFAEMTAWLRAEGVHDRFDFIAQGEDPTPDDVRAWADAGANWWLEAAWSSDDQAAIREKIDAGPPR